MVVKNPVTASKLNTIVPVEAKLGAFKGRGVLGFPWLPGISRMKLLQALTGLESLLGFFHQRIPLSASHEPGCIAEPRKQCHGPPSRRGSCRESATGVTAVCPDSVAALPTATILKTKPWHQPQAPSKMSQT